MAWEINYSNEFEAWWDGITANEQDSVTERVKLLMQHGPNLRRPYVGKIEGSKHANMKELIVQHAGEPFRVLFIFDPRKQAVLLIGGNKGGNDRWYEEFVPRADKIYDRYLVELQMEGLT